MSSIVHNKNDSIQALRGTACLAVFLSHLFGVLPNGPYINNISLNDSPLRILWGGNAAVVVFFVLSGFFYYKKKEFSLPIWIDEIIKRHIRIYPVLFLSLILALIARISCPDFNSMIISNWASTFWQDSFSIKQFIMHFFPITSFDSHFLIPPIWTLRIELRMIFVLPLIRYMLNKFPPILVLLTMLAVAFFVPVFMYLPAFVIGMIAKKYVTEYQIKINSAWKICLVIISILLLDTEYLLNYLTLEMNKYFVILLTSAGAIIVVVLLYSKTKCAKIFCFLSKLGNISFAFYLIHFVVLMWFRFLVELCGMVWYYKSDCININQHSVR